MFLLFSFQFVVVVVVYISVLRNNLHFHRHTRRSPKRWGDAIGCRQVDSKRLRRGGKQRSFTTTTAETQDSGHAEAHFCTFAILSWFEVGGAH